MMEDGADQDFHEQISDQSDNELVHGLLSRGEFVGLDFEIEHHFGAFAGVDGALWARITKNPD